MLSSVNAFGGLSAAELLTLFGANSASASSSSSTSKSTAPSTSTGITGSSAAAPENAIQAILAQAQITHALFEQSLTETSAGRSASITTVAAAYAAQTDSSGAGSTTSVIAETAYTVQIGSFSSLPGANAETASWQYSSNDGVNGSIISASYNVTSTPSASGSIDNFQLSLTLGNDTLNIDFTVDGLGQLVGSTPVGLSGVSVGQGNDGEMLEVMATNDTLGTSDGGESAGIGFVVGGLDAAQEQQVAVAFEAATSSPSETRIETEGSNYIQYDENLGQGFTATFSAGGDYSLTPAQMAASGA